MPEFLYKNPQKNAFIIIIFLAIFSTIYNAYLPLHGDEAYYWVWSHHLQFGYFDHPPMVAFLIHLSNYISESEWGVRLTSVVSMSLSALYVFKLTKLIFDEKTALDALMIFASVILVHAGYILITTDAPLILFWTLTLYYSYKAIFYNTKTDYILSGIFLGLMMLSKYTSILFVIFLILFMTLKKREVFKNIYFYIAALIAFIIVLPMVYWNYQNDWISFAFQISNRSAEDENIHFDLLVEFLSGQFGIFSPIFAGVFFYFLFKKRLFIQDEKLFFLALSSAVILIFFTYKSLYSRMELNFAAPAYISGAILSAYIFSKYELHKTFKVGLTIAIFSTIIGRVAFITHLEIVQDRMYGNKEAVKLVESLTQKGDYFYGDHLTTTSYLQYYLPNHPNTDLALPNRYSQYDMWRKKDYLHNGLVLSMDDADTRLTQLYTNVKLLKTLSVKRGTHGTKTFYIYRVADAK